MHGKSLFALAKYAKLFVLNLLWLSLFFFFTVDVYSPEFFRLFIIQYGTNKDDMFKNPEI